MAAQTRRPLAIEQALRDALAQGELTLDYQPQVDLARWQVIGFEALLRWQHPQLGEVLAGRVHPGGRRGRPDRRHRRAGCCTRPAASAAQWPAAS